MKTTLLTEDIFHWFTHHFGSNFVHNWRYPVDSLWITEQTAFLISIRACQNTLVITGDFTIPKCRNLYQKFVDLSLVVDVSAGDDAPTFHGAFLPPGAQLHCIDYLFFCPQNKEFSVRKLTYLFQEKMLVGGQEQYISDYMGLMAEVTLPPS